MASTREKKATMNCEEFVKRKFPSARLVGPSGDGCHVEVDGKWFAYGNLPENAWKSAADNIRADQP